MTKIDARLALVERQRRFEWDLARDAHTRAAGQFVAGKTHDLLNLVQIVQLATLELSRRSPPEAQEFIHDLTRAADDARQQLASMMAIARPDEVIVAGAPVGETLAHAVLAARAASTLAVELHMTIEPGVTTRCQAADLEHLIFGMTLDAEASGDPAPIELSVRTRTIERQPWLEIVRGPRAPVDGEHFDLRAVELIATKNGGELAHSERRDGTTELVVALPIVAPKP